MPYAADPRVDDYIDALPDWQQEICREVRGWCTPRTPRWSRRSNGASSLTSCSRATSAPCWRQRTTSTSSSTTAASSPTRGIITGGHGNKTARTVAIGEGETINAPALKAMFKQIIANNRAGGWRKLKE